MAQPESYWAINLKHLRNRKGMSQEEMAERMNISRSKLAAHENNQTKNPPVEDLVRFSEYFRISIDNLLRQNLSQLAEPKLKDLEAGNEQYVSGNNLRVLTISVDSDNNNNIEVVPVKAKAGYTAGYGDPEYIAGLPMAAIPHLPRGKKFRMFPVSGDSMLPVPDGSYVIASYIEDWKSVKTGTACILILKEEGIVFKIVHNYLLQDRKLLLESLNTIYKPYEVSADEVLEVWAFHSYISTDILQPKLQWTNL